MKSAGIDLGGTKIETQIFDENWLVVAKQRVETPKSYDALVAALAGQIRWAKTYGDIPVGVGAAGLVNPENGLALTANICANDKPFPADAMKAAGSQITYVNDCRALALSEAVFGVGRAHRVVVGLVLGTGVGGGVTIDGKLLPSGRESGGEFGHMSAPAHLVLAYNLPIVQCGCGRKGCIETLIAGAGMTRIAEAVIGQSLSAPEIAAERTQNPAAQQVWEVWTDLVADLLLTISRVCDPDIIVLGGGLSKMAGVTQSLQIKLNNIQFKGFGPSLISLAEGGEASGARGAAYAAWQEANDG